MTATVLRVSDLNIVGFLVTRGHEILGVEGSPAQQVFCFSADAQADVDAYHRNAPVPARAFAAALRDLKGLLKRPGSTHISTSREPSHDSQRNR